MHERYDIKYYNENDHDDQTTNIYNLIIKMEILWIIAVSIIWWIWLHLIFDNWED